MSDVTDRFTANNFYTATFNPIKVNTVKMSNTYPRTFSIPAIQIITPPYINIRVISATIVP